MTHPLNSVYGNMGAVTALVENDKLLWHGVLHYAPGNAHEMKRWFVKSIEVSKDMFVSWKVRPENLKQVLHEKMMERLKDVPQDPIMFTITMVGAAAGYIFICVLGFKNIARL